MTFQQCENLRIFFDNMPYIVWLKDNCGRYQLVNKRFFDFTKLESAAVLGKTDEDIFPADAALVHKQYEEAVLQSKKTLTFEHFFPSATGNLWFETYVAPNLTPEGEVNGILGISRRIPKRKWLEKELKTQKRFLKTMLDSIPDFIFYKDTTGALLGCNQACIENIYGLPEAEVIGKTSLDIIQDPSSAINCHHKDLETLRQKRTIRYEEKLRLLDGRISEVETEKTPFYDEQGSIAGLIGVSREITARKKLEQQLRESQERYAAIVNNAPQIVLIHKDDIILFINEAGEKTLGYPREELIGFPTSKIHPFSSLLRINQVRQAEGAKESVAAFDIELVKRSGKIINAWAKSVAISFDGEPARLVVFIDMTERKKVEERIKANEERFRQFAETVNEVFAIRDQENLLYLSPAYEKIFGRSSQVLLKDPLALLEFIHPEDAPKVRHLFLYGGQHMEAAITLEYRIIHPDGGIRWCYLQSYPIKEQNGAIKRKAITISDITERKRIGEELRTRVKQAELELNLAARVQRETLPPPFDGEKIRVKSLFMPYNTVSGDLYNYKWFENQAKLRGYVVDVSGHGVAIALQTATLKMLLDNELLNGGDVDAATFRLINEKMLQYLHEECFAGLLYFEFDFTNHMLTVTSGGINLFLLATSDECKLVPIYSCYLGMFEQMDIATVSFPFKPGDVYCMMTDGVSDLIEQAGLKRQQGLVEYLSWLRELGQNAVDRSDDFSAVCLEIVKPQQNRQKMLIQHAADLSRAQQKLGQFLAERVPDGAVMLEVAVNEALNNSIRAGSRVEVRAGMLGRKIVIRIKDDGPGFDTGKIKEKLKRKLDESGFAAEFDELSTAECGRGILMMQMLCDKVIYNRKGNEVLLVKQVLF